MLRLRRYRVFLIVAILSILTIWHLTRVQKWDAAANFERLKSFGGASKGQGSQAEKPVQPDKLPDEAGKPAVQDEKRPTEAEKPAVDDVPVQIGTTSTTTSTSTSTSSLLDIFVPTPSPRPASDKPDDPDTEPAIPPSKIKDSLEQMGIGRLDTAPLQSDLPQAHWEKQTEHFPIPPGSLIPLPAEKSKVIPKIQKAFAEESVEAKTDRERKLAMVKEAFMHSWTSYKTLALPHDELTPVSGKFKDPFMGWGATLVDTLDTLWIMGLTEEFELAVKAVAEIDFTTSARKDIPVFETVIRYLGGLLSAYDLSDGVHKILLDKAEELAEVLMGAFDTPNRMPMTFYNWAPSYASQPHRAGTRVVLAEIGSLSMEFTRLAQLTGEDKYYDAIARVTNELETWQSKTRLPGLWPLHLDASGCKKPEKNFGKGASSSSLGNTKADESKADDSSLVGKASANKVASDISSKDLEKKKAEEPASPDKSFMKRQIDDAEQAAKATLPRSHLKEDADLAPGTLHVPKVDDSSSKTRDPDAAQKQLLEVDCEPQELTSPPYAKSDKFALGAMSDSTFEYLPKEYMLLGGQVSQYQSMYEYAMKTTREKLLFRPMIRDEKRELLFAGILTTSGGKDYKATRQSIRLDEDVVEDHFNYEAAHLTCFAGGMFAVGAKIFEIEGDLDIARKLTDGCVWAYESTVTKIMPEAASLTPCEDMKSCEWNETRWWDFLDPDAEQRMQRTRDWNDRQMDLAEQVAAAETLGASGTAGTELPVETAEAAAADTKVQPRVRDKRQIGKSSITYEDSSTADARLKEPKEPSVPKEPTKTKILKVDVGASGEESPVPNHVEAVMQSLFTPQPVVSHEDYANKKIKEYRLPESYTKIASKKYILRPEAIESVFLMYRITGDEYWRNKGWDMFSAIQQHTRVEFGNSAIKDVFSEIPEYDDTMESFWLAETLKYFYLLYSDPSVVSLDKWVLNTEAHPFKRPVS